jgi:hypothetical protein
MGNWADYLTTGIDLGGGVPNGQELEALIRLLTI